MILFWQTKVKKGKKKQKMMVCVSEKRFLLRCSELEKSTNLQDYYPPPNLTKGIQFLENDIVT